MMEMLKVICKMTKKRWRRE